MPIMLFSLEAEVKIHVAEGMSEGSPNDPLNTCPAPGPRGTPPPPASVPGGITSVAGEPDRVGTRCRDVTGGPEHIKCYGLTKTMTSERLGPPARFSPDCSPSAERPSDIYGRARYGTAFFPLWSSILHSKTRNGIKSGKSSEVLSSHRRPN